MAASGTVSLLTMAALLLSCHSRLQSFTPLPGVVCWQISDARPPRYAAEGIIIDALRHQGDDSSAVEDRRIFGTPQFREDQARVITSNRECARAAAALAAALRAEDLELPIVRRVAAAYLGRYVAIQLDEPGMATVHILDGGRRVGGWSGP